MVKGAAGRQKLLRGSLKGVRTRSKPTRTFSLIMALEEKSDRKSAERKVADQIKPAHGEQKGTSHSPALQRPSSNEIQLLASLQQFNLRSFDAGNKERSQWKAGARQAELFLGRQGDDPGELVHFRSPWRWKKSQTEIRRKKNNLLEPVDLW